MNILVVDDDQAICVYLTHLMEKWGYHVFSCYDAVQALQVMQNQTINLLLTDWMMPGLSGIELSKRIRLNSYAQYIYIIILTGRSEKEDVVTGIESGADDFLIKPINTQELQVRLKAAQRLIRLEQSLNEKNNALSLANKQIKGHLKKLQIDLDAAASLQNSLLPKKKWDESAIDIAWSFQPAMDLGGDIIGIYALDNEQLGFYILDVSGHGIPAAMLSVYLHNRLLPEKVSGNLIYSQLNQSKPYSLRSPAEIVTQLNQDFDSEKHNNLYFTMLFGMINKYTGEGQFCQAGHPYPLICSAAGEVKSLGKGGFPVGLMDEARYENITFSLNTGEKLLIYSDGITECFNQNEEEYGISQLGLCLSENNSKNLPNILEQLKESAQQWQDSVSQESESESESEKEKDRNGPNTFKDDVSLLLLEKK